MGQNAVLVKSKAFALRIIKIVQQLQGNRHEFVLTKQLLRSGTSIGANIREAMRGESKPDFYHKLNISLKEADETSYWLELLHESNYISNEEFNSVIRDCNELISLLVAITRTQKR
jgi:four helix bundle protein